MTILFVSSSGNVNLSLVTYLVVKLPPLVFHVVDVSVCLRIFLQQFPDIMVDDVPESSSIFITRWSSVPLRVNKLPIKTGVLWRVF